MDKEPTLLRKAARAEQGRGTPEFVSARKWKKKQTSQDYKL
jgi:hypothetical protein